LTGLNSKGCGHEGAPIPGSVATRCHRPPTADFHPGRGPDPKVRLSCGFPSKHATAQRRRIGECWEDYRSADGHSEIFIHPQLADPMRVAGTLAHELIHAAVGDECGHRGPFRKLALAIGLEGNMTETDEGDTFNQMMSQILAKVGPYPHAELDVSGSSPGRGKQGIPP
jgi:hypothetical protein